MHEHTTTGRLPHLKTTPPSEMIYEIAQHNTSFDRILENASLLLALTDGEETEEARMPVERGYSDAFNNGLSSPCPVALKNP